MDVNELLGRVRERLDPEAKPFTRGGWTYSGGESARLQLSHASVELLGWLCEHNGINATPEQWVGEALGQLLRKGKLDLGEVLRHAL